MFREQTAGDVHRAYRDPRGIKQISCTLPVRVHVQRANTVIEKRQWMQQDTTAFAGEDVRRLGDDSLSVSTQLAAEHDDDVALRLTDGLAQSFELGFIYSHLARRQGIVTAVDQREHRRVLCASPDMNELRSLLAQANGHAVDKNELGATVTYGLPNLFTG